MDPVTQGCLGAAASQAALSHYFKGRLWLVGALGGMAADLDFLIRDHSNPLLFFYYHRHFTHSLVFVPIGGILVGLFCLMLSKNYREQWKLVLLAATIGYATHGLLDSLTSYGTLLYWPFTLRRIAWDSMSIIDLIPTTILFVGAVFSARLKKAYPAQIAVALFLIYVGFGFYQHHRASEVQQQLIQERHHEVVKARVAPGIGNIVDWRSFYRTENEIYEDIIKVPLFKAAYAIPGLHTLLFKKHMLPERITQSPTLMSDYNIFLWFTDGFISTAKQTPLTLVDMRYLMQFHPPISLWGIEFPSTPERKHIYWLRNVKIG